MRPTFRLLACAVVLAIISTLARAQDLTPPAPQKLTIHSNVLNEDRVIWVRTPKGYEQSKNPYPVLYLTDGDGHINEIGNSNDFLVNNQRMPPLIVVGIANTDRTRDLTPSHSDAKDAAGKEQNPTSGGADHFLDFIQTELMPEIDKRYHTAHYKIFSGHSLGGLLAIHILITRPDMFDAYIAVSPSLWWNDKRTLHQAQDFFASRAELHKTLFFSLGNENGGMREGFDALKNSLDQKAPNDFHWNSALYEDEDHGSTVLRAHYAGLRTIFSDWQMPRDPDNGMPVGGLAGMEKHYHELSARYGYEIPLPENAVNGLGYALMGNKKLDEAIAVFQRNVVLYPASANVYDSLGEGYENMNKFDLATENVQKAIDMGSKNGDPNLGAYKDHMKRVVAEAKTASDKASTHN